MAITKKRFLPPRNMAGIRPLATVKRETEVYWGSVIQLLLKPAAIQAGRPMISTCSRMAPLWDASSRQTRRQSVRRGYTLDFAETREGAMAAFTKSWRRGI